MLGRLDCTSTEISQDLKATGSRALASETKQCQAGAHALSSRGKSYKPGLDGQDHGPQPPPDGGDEEEPGRIRIHEPAVHHHVQFQEWYEEAMSLRDRRSKMEVEAGPGF